MAALDAEAVQDVASQPVEARLHLACCPSCSGWLRDLELMTGRFREMSYPSAELGLWAAVRDRLHQSSTSQPLTYPLWLIGALVVGWRALQLIVDLPFPLLHPIVPIAAAIAALWLIAGDPLAIQTVAPELQKRGL